MLRSQLCTVESLRSPGLRAWAQRLRPMWAAGPDDARELLLHRKMWEWLFIAQVLRERGLLGSGHAGLGFGVGQEPLVALFAAEGCDVVATDQPRALAQASGWTDSTTEWAAGFESLNRAGLCPSESFTRHVRYRPVDMNAIPDDLRDFDFTWSSCALEHLGSLDAGAAFVLHQMACLRPGGTAVHTTEYVVSSDTDTVEKGGTVLYRRRDIEALAEQLRAAGHEIELDLTEGSAPEDIHVDAPPYSDVHLRTLLGQYVTTSLALVVTKGRSRAGNPGGA